MSEDNIIKSLAELVKMDKEISEKLLISEFVEDISYVWNHPQDFNKFMDMKKKWEEKLK